MQTYIVTMRAASDGRTRILMIAPLSTIAAVLGLQRAAMVRIQTHCESEGTPCDLHSSRGLYLDRFKRLYVEKVISETNLFSPHANWWNGEKELV